MFHWVAVAGHQSLGIRFPLLLQWKNSFLPHLLPVLSCQGNNLPRHPPKLLKMLIGQRYIVLRQSCHQLSGVGYAKSLSLQYFIDVDILQNSLIDIDIYIIKKVHIVINIFKNDHIDINTFKSGLINININIFKMFVENKC